MTPFALRLCFFDPERDAPDYGGERSTFVVRAETMSEALVRWLDRAEARDVELHLVEQAGVVGGGDLGDLVEASQAGGIAAGQSYAYTPLAEAQGVYFGLVETTEDVAEVAVKGENASAALRRLIAEAGGGAWEIRAIDGFCDLSQAEESATFNGTPLKLAALGVSMGEGFQIGARYALEGGEMPEGSCLCGAIRYRVKGPMRPVVACHCVQCRKTSGHYVAATSARREDLEISGDVAWFASSEAARRGFCATCGSSLFWDGMGEEISIHAGTLDGETGLALHGHIFCADKGDYYELDDGLPRFASDDEALTSMAT